MKRSKNTWKRFILCVFCLSLVTGYLFAAPSDSRADTVFSQLVIENDYKLKAGSDLGAYFENFNFLEPSWGERIKMVHYGMYYIPDDGSPEVFVTPAVEGKYRLEIQTIELKEGGTFSGSDKLTIVLNGKPASGILETWEDGSSTANCYWIIEIPQTFQVVFDTRGGSPVPEKQLVKDGGTIKKPTDPGKAGFEFSGWAVYKDGEFKHYWDFNQRVDGIAPYLLVAMWTKLPPPTTTTTTTTTAPTTSTTSTTTSTETTKTISMTTDLPAVSKQTTSPDSGEDQAKIPLYIIIGGVVIVLWILALIIYSVVYRRKKDEI